MVYLKGTKISNLTFYYSTMAAGKSAACLQMNFSLKTQGFNPLLVKSVVDTRDVGMIKSRIGLEHSCELMTKEDDVLEKLRSKLIGVTHVLVDEVQFLSVNQINELSDIVDLLNIDVICFGLRTDYRGELFETSARLFALADNLIEIPMICADSNKAIMHLKYVNNKPVFDGDSIEVGGDEKYKSVSRKQWKIEKNKSKNN